MGWGRKNLLITPTHCALLIDYKNLYTYIQQFDDIRFMTVEVRQENGH